MRYLTRGISIRTAMRAVRLVHRLLRPALPVVGIRGPTVTTRHGVQLELDPDEAIDFGLLIFRTYEPELCRAIDQRVGEGSVVLDIGANTGVHTLRFAQRVGASGRVYAFEPTRFALSRLRRNVELNPTLAPRIHPLEIGLVDRPGASLPRALSSSWSLTAPFDTANPLDMGFAQSTEVARFVTLDQWVREAGLTRLDWLKLDVDGFEVRVLRGATQTLQRFRPKMFIELAPHHFTRPDEPFEALIALLEEAGYRLVRFVGEALPLDSVELRHRLRGGVLMNALALPHAE